MPIFDDSVVLSAPRASVMQTVKSSFGSHDTLIVLREAPIIIGLSRDMGYVYCVGSDTTGATQLRLIVDRAIHVRNAFRGGSPRAALETLARTSRGSEAQARETARAALDAVQASLANGEMTATSQVVVESAFARLFSRPRLRRIGK